MRRSVSVMYMLETILDFSGIFLLKSLLKYEMKMLITVCGLCHWKNGPLTFCSESNCSYKHALIVRAFLANGSEFLKNNAIRGDS